MMLKADICRCRDDTCSERNGCARFVERASGNVQAKTLHQSDGFGGCGAFILAASNKADRAEQRAQEVYEYAKRRSDEIQRGVSKQS